MRDVLRLMQTALFPKRCGICGEVIEFDSDLCENCIDLPVIEPPFCPKCGCKKSECICKKRQKIREYKAVIAPFYYENQIQQGILNFKMHSMPFLAESYGKMLADTVKKYYTLIDFDCVTYVPMRKSDEIKREFNQSKLLAEVVARECKIPLHDLTVKKRKTKVQKKQSATERFVNMYDAFDLVKNVDVVGKTILLVDDVKTTGATLSSVALTLKAYGAKAVYCVTIAVVKRRSHK